MIFLLRLESMKLLPEIVCLKLYWLFLSCFFCFCFVFFFYTYKYICSLGLQFKLHVTFPVSIHIHVNGTGHTLNLFSNMTLSLNSCVGSFPVQLFGLDTNVLLLELE